MCIHIRKVINKNIYFHADTAIVSQRCITGVVMSANVSKTGIHFSDGHHNSLSIILSNLIIGH